MYGPAIASSGGPPRGDADANAAEGNQVVVYVADRGRLLKGRVS